MAEFFWYELSLADPDLYMEAQTRYLKALAEFLGPETTVVEGHREKKDVRESPFSDQTRKMYTPDLSDRSKPPPRSHLDEVPIQGVGSDFFSSVDSAIRRSAPHKPTGRSTQRRGKDPPKASHSAAAPQKRKSQGKKPVFQGKSKARDVVGKRESGEKLEDARSSSMVALLHSKPLFCKLIRDGSKPPGDVESVTSSVDDFEVEALLAADRATFSGFPLPQFSSLHFRKCPFCGVLEDVENDPLPPLHGPRNRLVLKGGGWKDFLPDGSVIAQLPNGDFKHTFPRGQVVYLFSREKVVQVIYPQKHTISLFPSGQLEVVCPEGRKFVCFPDKTAAMVHPDGSLEDIESFLC